jgi:hypothetical protein
MWYAIIKMHFINSVPNFDCFSCCDLIVSILDLYNSMKCTWSTESSANEIVRLRKD